MEHPLADDSPTKPVSGKLGRYELVKRLAQSGTAELLLARTGGRGFERHLVIKRLGDDQAKDAAFVKTFIAEARRASELHHRNIVQIQDVGESGGKPYVAMEYVHGEDLRKLLARLRGQISRYRSSTSSRSERRSPRRSTTRTTRPARIASRLASCTPA